MNIPHTIGGDTTKAGAFHAALPLQSLLFGHLGFWVHGRKNSQVGVLDVVRWCKFDFCEGLGFWLSPCNHLSPAESEPSTDT